MVGMKVRANLGMQARRLLALFTEAQVLTTHAIHIGRRASKVRDVALEVGHLRHLSGFAEYRLLAARSDELALMGRDGAERTTAEASTMHADRMTYHLVGRDTLTIVSRMRHTRIGQVEGAIHLLRGERRIGRIHQDIHITRLLPDALGMPFVALLLDMSEVLGLAALIAQAFLVRMQHDVALLLHDGLLAGNDLRDICYKRYDVLPCRHRLPLALSYQCINALGNFRCHLLAHAVGDDVGIAFGQQAGAQAVLPIVVVTQATQRRLDASQHDERIGIELAQYTAIDDRRHIRPHSWTSVGSIGIVRTTAAIGGIVVHHRIHRAR